VLTSATYYSSVRAPASSLVGAENQAWPLITNQVNHERVALTSAAPVLSALAAVREWASATRLADGRRVIDAEWVRLNLARRWCARVPPGRRWPAGSSACTCLTGIAAAGCVALNIMYITGGSAGPNGIFILLGVLLIAAWRVAGYLGADYFLLPRPRPRLRLRRKLRAHAVGRPPR
jgi:hypothetical protein